jgi:hypothetical protein
LSTVIPIAVAVLAVAFLLCVRRSRDPKEIARSLSIPDRCFLADELERITRLPTNTNEDVAAWYAATEQTQERLRERFPDVASVVPHRLYHYFTDADIHRKEPSYRAAQEGAILDFIRFLREEQVETQPTQT